MKFSGLQLRALCLQKQVNKEKNFLKVLLFDTLKLERPKCSSKVFVLDFSGLKCYFATVDIKNLPSNEKYRNLFST